MMIVCTQAKKMLEEKKKDNESKYLLVKIKDKTENQSTSYLIIHKIVKKNTKRNTGVRG